MLYSYPNCCMLSSAGIAHGTSWTPCKHQHVQKLNARIHGLCRKLDQQEQVKDIRYSRTREQLAKDLLQFPPGPTVDFVVSQVHVAKV